MADQKGPPAGTNKIYTGHVALDLYQLAERQGKDMSGQSRPGAEEGEGSPKLPVYARARFPL